MSTPAVPRTDWPRAWRAFRALMDDPDDTGRAMDFGFAIGQHEQDAQFRRFARHPEGRALLSERPDLGAHLADRGALARLPEGSLGRSYLTYLDANGFEPLAIVELHREVRSRWVAEGALPPLDAARAWYHDRLILLHDVHHVVTGYDTDGVGEAVLLAFTLGQRGGRAQRLLTVGAATELMRQHGWRVLRSEMGAWRRGRGAACLDLVRWEALLGQPLSSVQTMVGLAPFERAHPGGLPREVAAA